MQGRAYVGAFGLYAGQFGQSQSINMPDAPPMTGSHTYDGIVFQHITHTRNAPDDRSPCIPCTPLLSGKSIAVIKDPQFPTWAYISESGVKGWVGIQHVSAQSQPQPPSQMHGAFAQYAAHQVQPLHAYITARCLLTHSFTQPDANGPTMVCNAPQGAVLQIIGITADRQWVQLNNTTWVPLLWVQ
jgi:hypothetical protein